MMFVLSQRGQCVNDGERIADQPQLPQVDLTLAFLRRRPVRDAVGIEPPIMTSHP
jgi:hypothetical protein